MGIVPGDFELTMDELRVVARYAVDSAEEVLSIFEQVHPDDRRPRAAVEAAWIFAGGANRTMLQRTAAQLGGIPVCIGGIQPNKL